MTIRYWDGFPWDWLWTIFTKFSCLYSCGDILQVPLVNALSSVGQEKEELLKGMEVMEITRLWFNSRLEQLALEGKQPAKKVV